VIDLRRESVRVFTEFQRFHKTVGEGIVWFLFDVAGSVYDEVYDEGGKQYHPGIAVPILWVNQQEQDELYSAEGRRPTQRISLSVSARSIDAVRIGSQEAHGGRAFDIKPDDPWWDDRLNDVFYYDGRYYEVSGFHMRSRAQERDLIVSVGGIETQPEDERVFDLPIGTGA
jgi:hypothetical protein